MLILNILSTHSLLQTLKDKIIKGEWFIIPLSSVTKKRMGSLMSQGFLLRSFLAMVIKDLFINVHTDLVLISELDTLI